MRTVLHEPPLARRHADQLADCFQVYQPPERHRRAIESGFEGLTKKERLGMERDQGKLEASLGGIREMGGVLI